MAGTAGKSAVVKVSTATAGTYTTVVRINDVSMSHDGGTIDVTEFSSAGTSYRSRIQGLKDLTYTLSGFWTSTDTNGQSAIRSSWTNDSNLFLTFLPDGSTGWKQQVIVAGIDIGATVDGEISVTYNLEGNGALSDST